MGVDRDRSATPAETHVRVITRRSTPLRVLRDRWWRHHRSRYVARLTNGDRRHPFDEGYVADAMARQIEEIRHLPEIVC
jgi:hypothetical protein